MPLDENILYIRYSQIHAILLIYNDIKHLVTGFYSSTCFVRNHLILNSAGDCLCNKSFQPVKLIIPQIFNKHSIELF